MNQVKTDDMLALAMQVIDTEIEALNDMRDRLGDEFVRACRLLLSNKGKVIVSGMGKSGHISKKIAATLASTGTPAFFVHPSEALHGDLGMIGADDVLIAISYSGGTEELNTMCQAVKDNRTAIIAFTSNPGSMLASFADIHLNISVSKEACPMGLAPTSSTTVTLVLGDALAVSVLEARGFTANDFARSHPAGRLGRRLLLKVDDIMHRDDEIPLSHAQDKLSDGILTMTGKHLGSTIVVDESMQLLGIFTDGDLRRCIHEGIDINAAKLNDVVRKCRHTVQVDALANDALSIMNEHQITVLPVVDKGAKVCGIIHMHDLLTAGIA